MERLKYLMEALNFKIDKVKEDQGMVQYYNIQPDKSYIVLSVFESRFQIWSHNNKTMTSGTKLLEGNIVKGLETVGF